MKFPNDLDFINKHIRYKQHWNKKTISMTDAVWQSLAGDTMIQNIPFAKGSMFKVFETPNFGWIVFDKDSKTTYPDRIPARRIFKV